MNKYLKSVVLLQKQDLLLQIPPYGIQYIIYGISFER